MPGAKPEGAELGDEGVMRGLQRVLMETRVVEGKMVCGNCGHEYRIKEGIANFLLPNHLGEWRGGGGDGMGIGDAGLTVLQCERESFPGWAGWGMGQRVGMEGGENSPGWRGLWLHRRRQGQLCQSVEGLTRYPLVRIRPLYIKSLV